MGRALLLEPGQAVLSLHRGGMPDRRHHRRGRQAAEYLHPVALHPRRACRRYLRCPPAATANLAAPTSHFGRCVFHLCREDCHTLQAAGCCCCCCCCPFSSPVHFVFATPEPPLTVPHHCHSTASPTRRFTRCSSRSSNRPLDKAPAPLRSSPATAAHICPGGCHAIGGTCASSPPSVTGIPACARAVRLNT